MENPDTYKNVLEEYEKLEKTVHVCKNCGNEINVYNYPLHGDNICLMTVKTVEGNITFSEFKEKFL
jgi:hypothetical protein